MAKMVKKTMPAGICCSATSDAQRARRPTEPGAGVSSQTLPIASANGTAKTQKK